MVILMIWLTFAIMAHAIIRNASEKKHEEIEKATRVVDVPDTCVVVQDSTQRLP